MANPELFAKSGAFLDHFLNYGQTPEHPLTKGLSINYVIADRGGGVSPKDYSRGVWPNDYSIT